MTRYSGDPYWTTGKFGNCSQCGLALKGERIFYYPRTRDAYCTPCGQPLAREFEADADDEDSYNSQY